MHTSNKTFIVTGGANGIGRELVLNLLARGARVAAVDISEKALDETLKLAADDRQRLSLHLLDITDQTAVEAFPEQVLDAHGQVDGLINNAGIIQPFVRVNQLSYAEIERVLAVNFYGTLYMTKTFLPLLLKRPEAHLVNISSMGGFLPVPGQSVYGATKAAVKLMTEGLQAELSDTNVGVSIVFPGAIATNITENSGVSVPGASDSKKKPALTPMPADKAAEAIVRGMERNKVRMFVGSDSRMLDILYRISPGFATNLVARQLKSLLSDD